MAAPIDANWNQNDATDDVLNKVTYGQGTSFPATWPLERIFWRTDENKIYKNTNTVGSPVFEAIGAAAAILLTPAISTNYEDLSRFTNQTGGTGSLSRDSNGLKVDTGVNGGSFAKIAGQFVTDTALKTAFRYFASIASAVQAANHKMFWGVGVILVNGSTITYTNNQAGFKSVRSGSSGTVSATNGSGSAETATDIGETEEAGNYFIDKESSSSCKFYRLALSSTVYVLEATHTTNISTNDSDTCFMIGVSNVSVAALANLVVTNTSYQQVVSS